MSHHYDVIVVGLGAMGSAAVYHLAKRGKSVLGLDKFSPPHTEGSSHGRSRIIRQAYLEGEAYVPLVLRAYELWAQLEQDSGQHILTETGGLMIGSPESETMRGSSHSAQVHNLSHEILTAKDIRRRYPAFHLSEQYVALFEAKAGYLNPELAITTHLALAQKLGAKIQTNEPIDRWSVKGTHVQVNTAQAMYEAERLIISPGAWASQLLAELHIPLVVQRMVLNWFMPPEQLALFAPERFPVFIWEHEDSTMFYGFPIQDVAEGVKIALHNRREATTVDSIKREIAPKDIEALRPYVAECFPDLNGKHMNAVTCMYTTTPDEHFVLGLHPEHEQVVISSGYSGHGFKFSAAIGEVLADLALEGQTPWPIDLFDPKRFYDTRSP